MTHLTAKTILTALFGGLIGPLFVVGCVNAAESKMTTPSKTVKSSAVPVIADAPSAEQIAEEEDDGEPRPYDAARDARADVDAALFAARQSGKNAIIVMGANWCHDSRALAAHFMTPRFETLLAENFEYVYVDMGIRTRNLDIAADFGIDKVEGTPTIVITDTNGTVLNGDTAKTWRNAANRTEDEIYNEFASFVPIAAAED